MKPFRFRLERLKRVRSTQERSARASFASAIGELTRAGSVLRDSLNHRDAAREDLRHILAASNSVSSFLTAQRVTDRFDALVEVAEQDQARAALAVDSARVTWATLRSKDEGLSRLRAARQIEHRRETERWLARELDEVAITRAAKNRNRVGTTPTQTKSSS